MKLITDKNKICIVRKDIADEDRGGISFYYKGIIKELVKWGWDVTVITQLPFKNTEARVVNVPVENDYHESTKNVAKVLENIDVDIIEASNYKFELLEFLVRNKNKKNKPITIIRSEPSGVTCLFGNEYMYGEQTQSQLADYNLAVSKFAKNDTEKQYNIVNDQVIYLGVDLDRLFSIKQKEVIESGLILDETGIERKIEEIKIDKIIDKNKINIFWSGKPTHMKGYDYLENIIKQAPENFNFILNETPVSHTIKKGINGSTTLWDLKREDQISLWRKCDVTLLTSRVEGFSLVAAESLLLQKPLIANKQCDVIKEFPANKEIVFFNPNSIEDFIVSVKLAKEVKVKLSSKQLRFFDSKRLALETHYFYQKVLNFKELENSHYKKLMSA